MKLTPSQLTRILKKLPWWLQILVVVLFLVSSFWLQSAPAEPARIQSSAHTEVPVESAQVIRVIDGDTLRVQVAGQEETVRLVGIDTPETVDPRREVECFGQEATQAMTSLVSGQSVRLERDVTQQNRDRYGRLLRFVFLSDGRDVGLELISAGAAQESLYSDTAHAYHDLYVQAQQDAQSNERGLWAADACLEL